MERLLLDRQHRWLMLVLTRLRLMDRRWLKLRLLPFIGAGAAVEARRKVEAAPPAVAAASAQEGSLGCTGRSPPILPVAEESILRPTGGRRGGRGTRCAP